MNFFRNKTATEILKKVARTASALIAAFTLFALSGCNFKGGEENTVPDRIVISQTSAEITVGGTITLAAVSSEGRTIIWISSDEDVAEVDNGEVTGVGAGTASITATDGKAMASCEITVKVATLPDNDDDNGEDDDNNEPEEVTITISQTKAEIKEGDTLTLIAAASDGSSLRWSSTNGQVARVSSLGVVTALSAGTATIKASTGDAVATCEVTVKAAETEDPDGSGTENPDGAKIILSESSIEMKVSETRTLAAVVTNASQNISWASSDNTVVSIVAFAGVATITGQKAGTATITVSCGDLVAYCTVTVKAESSVEPDTPNYPDEPNVDPDSPEIAGRTLVWSDEFNGNSLDMTRWGYQTGTQDHYGSSVGASYWGNDEYQYYTDGANLAVSNGTLQITAKRENMGDRWFTSSRITTRDKFAVTFGYIEARMKTPAIDGMWPAFWMLPQPPDKSSSITEYGGWAANGEIDIMEAKGRLKNAVDTTIHFGGEWPANRYLTRETEMSSNTDEWHTYAVDWREEYICWLIDGVPVFTLYNDAWYSTASSSASAPFDKPFYILLNLAVGGSYDGYVSPPDDFTQATMYVDYVRVYA